MTAARTTTHVARTVRAGGPRVPRRQPLGLTLVELVLVSIMVTVISGALFVTSLTGNATMVSHDASLHVQQEARRALDSMTRELRLAGGTVNAAGSQLDFQVALGYDLGLPCAEDAVCWGAQDQRAANQPGWQVRYRLNGTQLVREIVDGTGVVQPGTRVLANDVSAVTFAYTGAPTHTVTVQLQVRRVSSRLTGGQRQASPTPLRLQVHLRNA